MPLRPERVVEVRYDHLEGRRFRRTAQFLRWGGPDRDPRSCTYDQLGGDRRLRPRGRPGHHRDLTFPLPHRQEAPDGDQRSSRLVRGHSGIAMQGNERLAARAVAQAAGMPAQPILAIARETGDLGLTVERAAQSIS